MPLATCYRFVRCQVHRAFDDVQGWFLEVRAGDSELLAAFHRSLTSKYHLIFGEDPHGGGVKDNGAALAAIEPVRQLVLEHGGATPNGLDIRYRLVAACMIMGVFFPEYERWYEDAVANNWGWGNYIPPRLADSFRPNQPGPRRPWNGKRHR